MRILLVHNFYGSSAPSGENRVVLDEGEMLRAAGHEVIEYSTRSDAIRDHGLLPILNAALFVPWNSHERENIRGLILKSDPDVMHVHNVFPLLSPAIFYAASGTRTAVVNTLHNYRTLCPVAMALRNGVTCTSCIKTRSVWPALWHGCYRNSRVATVPVAAAVALHRRLRTYLRRVDAFICLTQFQRSLLAQGGLPEQHLYVKPNCYPGVPDPVPWLDRDDKAVFLGRISAEKGADTLVEAWLRWGANAPKLEIIGGGPELEQLRRAVPAVSAGRIVFLGERSAEQSRALLSKAKVLILPSTWFEGFPLVLCEALAFGVPVLASRLGAFEELVQSPGIGRLFAAGNSEDLCVAISALWRDDAALQRMSHLAREEFETKYTPQKNIENLNAIYNEALKTKAFRLAYGIN